MTPTGVGRQENINDNEITVVGNVGYRDTVAVVITAGEASVAAAVVEV